MNDETPIEVVSEFDQMFVVVPRARLIDHCAELIAEEWFRTLPDEERDRLRRDSVATGDLIAAIAPVEAAARRQLAQ